MKRAATSGVSVASAVLAALALLSTGAAHGQGMYRWVDKDGKVHYSDKKPAEKPKNLEQRQVRGSVVETTVPGYALQEAMKANPVSLYTAPECKEACESARALLNKRGVPFKEISVTDNQMRDELIKVGGAAEVPLMLVGGSKHKGFEAGAYTSALDQAGYPSGTVSGRVPAAAPTREAPSQAKKSEPAKSGDSAPKGRYEP